jgi:hypothetical protein
VDLHPGVAAAFRRLGADELGIARLMAEGELVSPQRYENVTLFDIRITGTGISYRPSLNEYDFRKPENYLTPDFLARCNGLSVIMNHPKDSLLNSEEYADRIVGSVFLPYIKDEEVWAIAKIYDDEAIEMLTSEQMSTSPAVLLDKDTVRTRATLKDGTDVDLLVEGKAKLTDHIAICAAGVWDKGGPPTGISSGGQNDQANVRGDSIVADEKEMNDAAKADAARADAEKRADEKLDTILKGIGDTAAKVDACSKRMDAWEEEKKADAAKADAAKADAARKDAEDKEEAEKPEKLAADKRKDAEGDKEEDKKEDSAKKDAAKADAARADSLEKVIADQAKAIAELQAGISVLRKPIPESHRAVLLSLQSRADSIMTQMGERAPQPMVDEAPATYERRLVNGLKGKSKAWKDIDVFELKDAAFAIARDQVYADALAEARSPTADLPAGAIFPVSTEDNGHRTIKYRGGPGAHYIRQFARPFSYASKGMASFTLPGNKFSERN